MRSSAYKNKNKNNACLTRWPDGFWKVFTENFPWKNILDTPSTLPNLSFFAHLPQAFCAQIMAENEEKALKFHGLLTVYIHTYSHLAIPQIFKRKFGLFSPFVIILPL
jgi:hypothetical protein